MKSIIEELWYGNICPQEGGVSNSPEFKELYGYITRYRSELEGTMSDEQKRILNKMMECRNEIDCLIEAKIFANGLKLGAKLMLEMLSE